MKNFKQSLLVALGLIVLILLIACSPKTHPKTQTIDLQNFNSDGLDYRITLYYQGDKLLKSVGTYTALYKYQGIANATEAENIYGQLPENSGVTWTFDFQKDHYIVTSEIDYEKALQDKSNTFLQEFLAEDGKSVSLEKFKNPLITDGYKVIEDKKFQELP